MESCKLIFTFIFAITLAIDVVPSSASGSRKTSPKITAPPSPQGPAALSPRGTASPTAPGSAPPSPRVSVPPSPRVAVPPSPRCSIRSSPRGSVTTSPRGSEPSSPHGTAQSSPFGTAPSSPLGSPPLSPTKVEPLVPRIANRERGEHNFGEHEPGEQLLGIPVHIFKEQPDPTFASYGGVHTCDVTIRSPNGEKITRFEVDSCLGFHSEGEHVNFEGYSPSHDAVRIRIWSKRYTNINYKVRLYGL